MVILVLNGHFPFDYFEICRLDIALSIESYKASNLDYDNQTTHAQAKHKVAREDKMTSPFRQFLLFVYVTIYATFESNWDHELSPFFIM